jgi:hypothetical protein
VDIHNSPPPAEPTAAPDLFISYSSHDAGRVLPVAERLAEAGVSVWLDRERIAGGAVYGEAIVRAIKGCRALALMCSDASMRSRNVRQEILLAWQYEKPYLPLLLSPVSYPEQIEYWVQGYQWVAILDRPADDWVPRVRRAVALLKSARPDAVGAQGVSAAAASARGLGAKPSSVAARPGEEQSAALALFRPEAGLSGLGLSARFTDRLWPVPAREIPRRFAPGAVRGLGAPQAGLRRVYRLGDRVGLAVESDREGYLTLLNEGAEGIIYCLCPSWFAPAARLPAGRNYLPQPGAAYDAFEISGRAGREHLLAVISDGPLGLDWMPPDPETPARVLSQADVESLVGKLRSLDARYWTALATWFEVQA